MTAVAQRREFYVEDYATIQDALDAAGDAGGGRVLFRDAGVHYVTTSLQLHDAVQLIGVGADFKNPAKGTVIRPSTANGLAGIPVIAVGDSGFASIRDLAIYGGSDDATANTTIGIAIGGDESVRGVGDLTISGCFFRYLGGNCIDMGGNVNWITHNCARDYNGSFLRLYQTAGSGKGSDNFVAFNDVGNAIGNGRDGGTGATGDGIRIETGANNTIVNNHIYCCKRGIVIDSSSHQNRIEGNRVEKHDLHGIYITGSSKDNLVVGNVSYNNGYISAKTGITIDSGSVRNTIVGNKIHNQNLPGWEGGTNTDVGISCAGNENHIASNNIYAANLQAIKLAGASRCEVNGNYLHQSGRQGIQVTNGSNDNLIASNYVYAASQASTGTHDAILVDTNCDRNKLIGNSGYKGTGNTPAYGISISSSDCDSNVLIGNDLSQIANAAFNDAGTGTRAGIGVSNSASGSTLGTVVKKIQAFDASGTSLGYVPVYDAIT